MNLRYIHTLLMSRSWSVILCFGNCCSKLGVRDFVEIRYDFVILGFRLGSFKILGLGRLGPDPNRKK